jgi:hypothetical protein
MTDQPALLPKELDRFLRDASSLTVEQWTTIYWRFVKDAGIQKACRKFANVALQVWLDERNAMTEERKAAADAVADQIAARIHAVLAALPEDELDPDRGGRLRQRVQWILINTKTALLNIELLNSVATNRTAVRRFLSMFEGLIAFPEYQA